MAEITSRQVLQLFDVIGAISNSDEILMESAQGNAAVKITAELFRAYLNQDFTIEIDQRGYWTIGGRSTGTQAVPKLRNNGGNLEYSSNGGYSWELLIAIDDLMPVLTPEQISTLKLRLEDLSDEDIAALQAPAIEAAERAEAAREAAEQAASRANTAAEEAETVVEHAPYIGDNYNWWVFDRVQGAYRDSGQRAKQGLIYIDVWFDDATGEIVVDYVEQDDEDFVADLLTFGDGDLIINID